MMLKICCLTFVNWFYFIEADRCYVKEANAAKDKREVGESLKKVAQAYNKLDDTENIFKCYRRASQILKKSEKAECLLDCWKAYILAIARC